MTDQPPQDSYPPPQGPPPGWYPDPQDASAQRWWSGRDWTEHTQPSPGATPAAKPQPAAHTAPQSRQGELAAIRKHWGRNILTLIGGLVVAGVIISLLSHSSSGGSSGPCTSGACIATDIRQSLVNTLDKGDAVFTKMNCDPSSVKEPSSGTYTENCTAAYSDGTTASGTGTVDTSQNETTFTPSGL
jgi:hypothetical protein